MVWFIESAVPVMTYPTQAAIFFEFHPHLSPFDPMRIVAERPWLWFLGDQAARNGITDILVFGNFHQGLVESTMVEHGVSVPIRYFPVPEQTSCADIIRNYHAIFSEQFFVINGCHYMPLHWDKLRSRMNESSAPCVVVERKSAQLLGSPISLFDKKRVLANLSKSGASSLNEIISDFTESGEKEIELSFDPGVSFSPIEDSTRAEGYFTQKKIILLDRDGTLNHRPPKAQYVTSPEELVFLPSAAVMVKKFVDHGFRFIIITNQAGVGLNIMTEKELNAVHDAVQEWFYQLGGEVLRFYSSTATYYEPENFWRKPNPGLFLDASRDFNLRLDETVYIGDDARDMIAAWNANTYGVYVGEENLQSSLTEMQQKILRTLSLSITADG